MQTEMNAILRTSDRQSLSDDTTITFAVNANMVNIDTLIMDCYPNAERKAFQGLQACYKAVASGEADCVLVSNYRIQPEEETLRKNNLFSVPTGETLSFCFAIRRTDMELYSVMNKAVLTVQNGEMDAALASYPSRVQKERCCMCGSTRPSAMCRIR